jgi:hypothetical protein
MHPYETTGPYTNADKEIYVTEYKRLLRDTGQCAHANRSWNRHAGSNLPYSPYICQPSLSQIAETEINWKIPFSNSQEIEAIPETPLNSV